LPWLLGWRRRLEAGIRERLLGDEPARDVPSRWGQPTDIGEIPDALR
jgi:hypothetical protein